MDKAKEYIDNNIVEGLEYCRALAIHHKNENIITEEDAKRAINLTLEDVKELIDKELKHASLWRLKYLKDLLAELEKLKL